MKIEGLNQIPMSVSPAQALPTPQVLLKAPAFQERTRSTQEISPRDSEPFSPGEITGILETLNDKLESMQRTIQFTIDDESKDIVINVVDTSSGEVIRQIPPEEILRLRHALEEIAGLMLEEFA
ncbi:MAG TPA: flagellar protein FlaG [Deltaproteobacteria bacterium]|nr:flagellar protein FlaG [Deltaproteobacteria bacterium]